MHRAFLDRAYDNNSTHDAGDPHPYGRTPAPDGHVPLRGFSERTKGGIRLAKAALRRGKFHFLRYGNVTAVVAAGGDHRRADLDELVPQRGQAPVTDPF